MPRLFANNATSTLAAAIVAADTSLTLATGEGALFPSPSGGDFFDLTLTQDGNETSWEVVKCTARSGDALTVERGVYGFTAADWASGSMAELRIHKSILDSVAKKDEAQNYSAAQRGVIATLTYGATVTPSFKDANFFKLTATGAFTLANPTDIVEGQSGSIWIRQDATGSRAIAYGSLWKGSAPALSTDANAIDRLDYVVESATRIEYVLTKGLIA